MFLFGLGSHHTFYENSILSTSILSAFFLAFIVIGLFKGVKLKNTMPKPDFQFKSINPTDVPLGDSIDVPDIGGGGILEAIFAVILWIVAAILISLLLWIAGNVLVVVVAVFGGMLYWIFFRALRLVFKNSGKCQGDLGKSLLTGLFYTFLYNFWIYGIFMMAQYLKHE